MASNAFFDPITLLRVAPLVSSTATCWFSVDLFIFLGTFLDPAHHKKANEVVPSYFKVMLSATMLPVMTLHSITIGTGISNAWGRPTEGWRWYTAGTALVFFHMAFGPMICKLSPEPTAWCQKRCGTSRVPVDSSKDARETTNTAITVGSIQALRDDKPKNQGNKSLKKWLDIHLVRSIMADFPAWVCFGIAVLKSVRTI